MKQISDRAVYTLFAALVFIVALIIGFTCGP